MRIRLAFLVGILFGASLSLAVNGYTRVNTPSERNVAVQFNHGGENSQYTHGEWCMDGRVF